MVRMVKRGCAEFENVCTTLIEIVVTRIYLMEDFVNCKLTTASQNVGLVPETSRSVHHWQRAF